MTINQSEIMKKSCLLILFSCLFYSLSAQTDTSYPNAINEGTLVGIGGYHIKNTYLSPIQYSGTGLRIVNERMQMVAKSEQRISSYQVLDIDLSSVSNPAGTVGALAGFADYTFGYHYRFQPAKDIKLLAGASVKGMFGFVYNTQSANNPIATHIDLDLNISAMGIYTFRIKNYPLTCRLQTDIPLAGTLFTPAFGQSYYEIFGLGNTSGVVGFSSLHNKFAMRNYFSVDFNVSKITLRAGYLNSLYMTDMKDIQTRYISHNLMIGFVKEFISYSGKNLKKQHGYQSAYY
jgi:hypothetical protein